MNLFQMSQTPLDAESERIVRILVDKANDPNFKFWHFVNKGAIPSEWFDEEFNQTDIKYKVIKELQKRKYLCPDKEGKVMVNNQRLSCYKLNGRWMTEIQKEAKVIQHDNNALDKNVKQEQNFFVEC